MMSITNRVNQVYIDDGAVPSKNLDKPVSVPLKNIKSTNPTTDNKPVTKKETPNNQKKVEVYDFDFDYDFKKDIKKISDVENRIASILKTFKTENIYKYNEVGTTVSSNSNGLWSNVTNLWNNTTDKVRDFFSDVGADVSNAATGLWSETKSWWSDVEDWWAADALPWFKEASKNVWDVYSSTCATLSIAVVSLVEGVLQFGEAIVDFLALVGTGYCSIYTGLMDVGQAFWGAITGEEWSSLTKQMWNGTMGFVSEQYVAGWFDSLYANTRWGNYFKSKAYGFDVVRSVGTGIGYIAGVVALTVATFGAGSVVATGGSVSVTAATAATSTTQMAITATAAGIGKGVQNAWADGADLVEGLFSGTLTGVWEGVQFYIGGKIGAAGGWGDKIAGKLLGSNASGVTNKIVSSISRVLLDGIDGGVEGFVQPLLSSIYKDGYYVEDGENSKFVEFKDDMNVLERYKELFDDNGGWTAVWTEASIGSATSLLGEVFDLGKYFKDSKQTNADVKPNTEVKNLEQKNIDNQNLASNAKQELQKKFDDYVNQANYYASKGNFYSIKIENFDDIPTEFWDKVNDPTKIFFVKDGKRIDFFEARALSELDMSVDDVPTEISKLNYKKHKATKYAVEYLKSNVRKFAYKNTNVFDGLNTQIMENGLYHFTDASDEILESGYIKASGRSDSYGNKKTFFFNGIPEVGAYATNLDKLPIKTTAVRVQPTVDLVNSSKLKLRYIDDMAITFDGKFDLSGYDAEKCFFVLTTENGQLKYKQVSETIYNNYETTNIGKALSQYVSDKNNVVDIKSDFLSEISNRNGMSEFDGLTEDILVRPNMEITGKLLNVKQLMEIIQEPDKFSKFIDFKNNSDYFDGTKLEYAIGLKQVIESCEKNKIDLGITDIKKLEITKYLDDYIKNFEIYDKLDNATRFSNQTDVAIYFNDTRQYLYSKLKTLAQTSADPEYLAKFREINYDQRTLLRQDKNNPIRIVSEIDENKIFDFLKNKNALTVDDYNILQNMKNISNTFTQTEKDAIAIFTAWYGPNLAAVNRKATCIFKGHKFNGNDFVSAKDYLHKCIKEYNNAYGKNVRYMSVDEFNSIIDNVSRRHVLTTDAIVYRGVNKLFFEGTEIDRAKIIPGSILSDSAHSSTSVIPSNISNEQDYILEILAPKGTKVGYLESVTGVSQYNQQEMLIGRNSSYKVLKYPEEITINGKTKYKITVELLPEVEANTTALSKYANIHGIKRGISGDELIENMKRKGIYNRYEAEIKDIYGRKLYDGVSLGEHDYNHIKMVLLNSMYMADELGLSVNDMNLLVESAKYHDSGLKYSNHQNHSVVSASVAENNLKGKYSDYDVAKIKSIIEYHEGNEGMDIIRNICNKNGIYDDEEIGNILKISNILRDADGMDFARFPGKLNVEFYRNKDVANSITSASFDLRDKIAATNLENRLNQLISENNISVYNELQSLINTEKYPDYIIYFAEKYYKIRGFKSITEYANYMLINKTWT